MEQSPSPEQQRAEQQQQVQSNPPVAAVEAKGDLPRLFDERSVAMGSLVGTPVAGGILLAVNGLRLGQRGGAALGFVMGLVLTYSLLGLVGYVSRFVTPWVLVVVGSGLMWWVAGMLQGDVLSAHRKAGGRHVGVPAALLVGVLTAGLLFLAVKPFVVTRPVQQAGEGGQPGQGQVVRPLELAMAEKQLVKYFPPVTEEEARRVGQVLMAAGYFDKTGVSAREVVMGREQRKDGASAPAGALVIMFPLQPGKEQDQTVLKGFAMVAQGFAQNGVPFPFVIRFIGPDGKVLRDIRADLSATRPSTQAVGEEKRS